MFFIKQYQIRSKFQKLMTGIASLEESNNKISKGNNLIIFCFFERLYSQITNKLCNCDVSKILIYM